MKKHAKILIFSLVIIALFFFAEFVAGVTYQIIAGGDDANEREITGAENPGTLDDNETTFEVGCTQVTEGKSTFQADYHGVWIYRDVNIDQFQEIQSAYFVPNVTLSFNFPQIYAFFEDADTASSLATSAGYPSQVASTSAVTRWGVTASGDPQIDVTDAMQEVIDRSGWTSGNDLKVIGLDYSPVIGCLTSGTQHSIVVNAYETSAAVAADLVVTMADNSVLVLKPGANLNLKPDGQLSLKKGVRSTPPAEFLADFGTSFERSTEQFLRTQESQGMSDSKLVTYSFWVNRESLSGAVENWYLTSVTSGTTARFAILSTAGNLIRILTRGSGGTTIGDFSGSTALSSTNQWYHVMGSFNLANASQNHMYVNDVRQTIATTTYSDAAMDFTTIFYALGGNPHIDSQYSDASFSQFYINTGDYLDLSVEANRRKFIDANGEPVDLGADCSTPTGTIPEFCSPDADGINVGGGADLWPYNIPTRVPGPGAD